MVGETKFWMDTSILRKRPGDGLYAAPSPVAVDYLGHIYTSEVPKAVFGMSFAVSLWGLCLDTQTRK